MKTIPISPSQLAEHSNCSSLWIAYKNRVYDITPFIFDHPGGEELLLQHAGKKIDDVLFDKVFHVHSESALEILEDYQIGYLTDADFEYDENVKKHSEFIDIKKPMFWQCLTSNWTKEFYLKQIHIPRHTHGSAPIFQSKYLEVLTKTPWFVIPLVWLPVAAYFLHMAAFSEGADLSIQSALALFLIGIFDWSLIEYTLHRFMFHLDRYLPHNQVAFTLHFLSHGVHHLLPMDRMRLVMPPALLCILSYPIVHFHFAYFPEHTAAALISGSYFGYIMYDLMHYYLHHGRPLTEHIRGMKTYHLDHHYKEANLGFGITSKFWDRVFGTLLQ